MLQVTAIPAFTDNYIWCLHNEKNAWIVDPGDATPVLQHLKEHGLTLNGLLITHHHADHIGGLKTLLNSYKNTPVIGPQSARIPYLTQQVSDGDIVRLPELDCELEVIEVPAHTNEHIAFYGKPGLFCGDTLFSAGCGRLFEGTPQQMWRNLSRFAQLPETTKVYCAHEYTQANNQFALAVKPDDEAFLAHKKLIDSLRKDNQLTIPTTIAMEKKVNPFMRVEEPEIANAITAHSGHKLETAEDVFREMRLWKDTF
ncbi:MAG: hydroxyacylglutathione hydrolase [Aestuariibacter sp.]